MGEEQVERDILEGGRRLAAFDLELTIDKDTTQHAQKDDMINKGNILHKRKCQMIRDCLLKAKAKEWDSENHDAAANAVEHILPYILILLVMI